MIQISRPHFNKIVQQAKESLPIECCGILAGLENEVLIQVKEVYPMTNVDQSQEHFSLDPREQFEVYYTIRDRGLKMLGNYHSHPATPARPSAEDVRLAYDSNAVYMIISLMAETPSLKCFKIKDGQYTELPIVIME